MQELTDDNRAVAKHFDTKIVRYAGSFEGCGCGFNVSYASEWEGPAKEDELFFAGKESRRLLQEYVKKHQIRQIYTCWSGDEGLDEESHMDLMADQMTDLNFQFPQRVMLRITES